MIRWLKTKTIFKLDNVLSYSDANSIIFPSAQLVVWMLFAVWVGIFWIINFQFKGESYIKVCALIQQVPKSKRSLVFQSWQSLRSSSDIFAKSPFQVSREEHFEEKKYIQIISNFHFLYQKLCELLQYPIRFFIVSVCDHFFICKGSKIGHRELLWEIWENKIVGKKWYFHKYLCSILLIPWICHTVTKP